MHFISTAFVNIYKIWGKYNGWMKRSDKDQLDFVVVVFSLVFNVAISLYLIIPNKNINCIIGKLILTLTTNNI